MFQPATLADLPAFFCAHAHNDTAATGCSVVIAPAGATCGVDVRGGGPATRETDLLRPENMIETVHAVVLSGGSAFGLAASTGVMEELAAHDIGFAVENVRVPIVVGACLFDLLVGENTYPDAKMGSAACTAALARTINEPLPEGNVGAGCGASVGKILGSAHAMKAGFGVYGLRLGEIVVCALVAANALGSVCDASGTWIAGCRNKDGTIMEPLEAFSAFAAQATAAASSANTPCTNTTLGLIATNAKLTKAQATKVSSTAHDAYARAIKPVHTSNDGDTIFTLASGEIEASTDVVAILATEAMQGAIERAVHTATSAYGLVAARDIHPSTEETL